MRIVSRSARCSRIAGPHRPSSARSGSGLLGVACGPVTVLIEDRVRDPDPRNGHPLDRGVRQRDDQAGDDHHAKGIASAEAFGNATVVRAVAEAVHPPGVTRADLEAMVSVLVDAIRESASADRIARQLEEQAPMFTQLGRFLRTPGGVVAILAVPALVPPVVEIIAPDDPPIVKLGPSSAEVERIVEERLRELTESGDGLPDTE